MNRLSVFLMTVLIIVTLTITASSINNRGTYELVYPAEEKIERLAYDSDGVVWSDAKTSADDGPFGHTVESSVNVYSSIDPFLRGSYAVYAYLNHDWVDESNKRDEDDDDWYRHLHEDSYVGDTNWGDSYDETETIEYCVTDGWATARDIRTPSVWYGTSVYIPW